MLFRSNTIGVAMEWSERTVGDSTLEEVTGIAIYVDNAVDTDNQSRAGTAPATDECYEFALAIGPNVAREGILDASDTLVERQATPTNQTGTAITTVPYWRSEIYEIDGGMLATGVSVNNCKILIYDVGPDDTTTLIYSKEGPASDGVVNIRFDHGWRPTSPRGHYLLVKLLTVDLAATLAAPTRAHLTVRGKIWNE